MPASTDMPSREQRIRRLLARRKWVRRGLSCLVAVLGLSLVLDRAGAFGWQGNDWRRFNQVTTAVQGVVDGETLVIAAASGPVVVKLIGLDAPQSHWAEESKTYLANRTKGRNVILRLEPNRTRDEAGNLLAYVYINDGDHLNLDCVRDGQCFADRRVKHTFRPQFETAESEARNPKKPRGLWKTITEDQMPAWRTEWLRQLREERRK